GSSRNNINKRERKKAKIERHTRQESKEGNKSVKQREERIQEAKTKNKATRERRKRKALEAKAKKKKEAGLPLERGAKVTMDTPWTKKGKGRERGATQRRKKKSGKTETFSTGRQTSCAFIPRREPDARS
ncbi:conserved hypothetical protein, partial [Ixodes scapularis]